MFMFLIIYMIMMAVLGLLIGDAKGHPVLGGVLGVALGPIGLLIMMLIPDKEY